MQTTPTILLSKPETLFQHRAARFRQLAKTHTSLAAFLNMMAELADCQHNLSLNSLDTKLLDSDIRYPLAISDWRRDSVWRENLRQIVEYFKHQEGNLKTIINHIQQTNDEELEMWADQLLAGEMENLEPGIAPFVAAALQVYWVSLAAQLDADKIKPGEIAYFCPVCGSLPVASLLQTGGSVQGLRYCCCGLCATEWNYPRIVCLHCGSSKGVAYYGVEGAGEIVKAEACAECNTYIKLMNREMDISLDPCADDLATLSLDMLMAEETYQRLGFNLLLITG